MTGTLFAGNPLKVLHFGGDNGRPDEADLLDARRVCARMIVLDEQLNVLHALELDEAQRNDQAVAERLGIFDPVVGRGNAKNINFKYN